MVEQLARFLGVPCDKAQLESLSEHCHQLVDQCCNAEALPVGRGTCLPALPVCASARAQGPPLPTPVTRSPRFMSPEPLLCVGRGHLEAEPLGGAGECPSAAACVVTEQRVCEFTAVPARDVWALWARCSPAGVSPDGPTEQSLGWVWSCEISKPQCADGLWVGESSHVRKCHFLSSPVGAGSSGQDQPRRGGGVRAESAAFPWAWPGPWHSRRLALLLELFLGHEVV